MEMERLFVINVRSEVSCALKQAGPLRAGSFEPTRPDPVALQPSLAK